MTAGVRDQGPSFDNACSQHASHDIILDSRPAVVWPCFFSFSLILLFVFPASPFFPSYRNFGISFGSVLWNLPEHRAGQPCEAEPKRENLTKTMSTFHPFPRLPQELRAHIWSLAAHPRLVHLRWKTNFSEAVERGHVVTLTPCPPVMQVCRESRQHAPYRRAFTIGAERRYFWANFETDIICLQEFYLKDLESHKLDMQPLRITAKHGWSSYEAFRNWDINDLRDLGRML